MIRINAAPGAIAQRADIFVTPIPNAPFSGVITVQRSIVQQDGALLNLKTVRAIGRDSQGRIHNETRMLVPAAASQRNGIDSFVYAVSGGAVSLRKITVLTTEQSVAAVIGLQAGETVSISGFDKLEDGSPVKIQDTNIQEKKVPDQGGPEQPPSPHAPPSVVPKADPTAGSH